jgi:hypothetical protein
MRLTLHFYLLTCGRNAEEFAAMSAVPGKAAEYLFPFSYQLLDYPMDVGKGGAKRANHLFKTFAPLLLARKGVEFHEINSYQIVRPLKVTLINDFLNKAGAYAYRG